ncbi:hypothetical protein MNBD_GAMMA11-2908 [hydrothermal vent metagenome]|uniref:HTH araC/xylS-type domain-containing protein n=1 Tax=hydrothermal vent metagenome TaxID=652676 RepID=A0A3B0WU49_9ZZZZ
MAKTPENNAKTTEITGKNDVFNDVLSSLKITGSVLLNEDYVSPWAVSIPQGKDLPGSGQNTHVAAFHLVRRGVIEIELENGSREIVCEGELVVCFSASAHTLSQGKGVSPRPFMQIMQEGENIFKPDKETFAQSASLICGTFMLHNTFLNPLFESLPPLLKVTKKQGNYYDVSTTATIIELLQKEIDQYSCAHGFIIARYLELLCAKTIQQYTRNLPSNRSGWLQAIKDPLISQLISDIHLHPANSWSVKEMAKRVALSPSRFAARFSNAMGAAPMSYVTQWRIYQAIKLLNDTRDSVEQISLQTGYENVAAFGRAFKRNTGISPGKWRKERGADISRLKRRSRV